MPWGFGSLHTIDAGGSLSAITPETGRAILIGKGWVSTFNGRSRASRLATKPSSLNVILAFCPDLTVRRVVGFVESPDRWTASKYRPPEPILYWTLCAI